MATWDDGDTVELEDGRTARIRIRPDEYYDGFKDVDCYGEIFALERQDPRQRPGACDGNAEKLPICNDVVWWQPPADVKRTDPGFKQLRQLVQDLASFGWTEVSVEVLDGEDAYGRAIVVDVASLCGIDSLDNGYDVEVVSDLMSELGVEPAKVETT